MSAPVFLLNHSTGTPVGIQDSPEDAQLAEANHQIPILWLALFTEADLITAPLGNAQNEDGEVLPEPTLFTSRQAGLATYARRRDAIRNKLGTARARYIDEWERLLASKYVQGTHFQIELFEVYAMDADEFVPVLLSWLEGIEKLAGPGWESLCGQAELDNPGATEKWGIRGSVNYETLGWED